jgi:hypothetical protein
MTIRVQVGVFPASSLDRYEAPVAPAKKNAPGKKPVGKKK